MSIDGIRRVLAAVMLLIMGAGAMGAREMINVEGELTANAGLGDFAPYYEASLRHGTLTASSNALLSARVYHPMDSARRFSWHYGARLFAGVSSSNNYARYDTDLKIWTEHSEHPANFWVQELYAAVKYRCLFLEAGARQQESPLLNQRLTSGDLMLSGNTRPLPGVRAGFIDFQDIPLTRGWVQLEGQLFYGRYTDSDWWEHRFNYYNGHIASGQWLVYRRCYFRTKPTERFSVTVGVQCASQFGGTTYYYKNGVLQADRTMHRSARFKDFVKMLWPLEGSGEDFYQGNTLGSWDFKARYRLQDDSQLKFYFQWPWDDGSGIGKLNGFDGLWGLEYNFAPRHQAVRAVVLEYLNMVNQSGPMHWDPVDNPGTTITAQATGADDYYNNAFYNPYAVYGMAMGSPMVMSPIYNLDGYMQFVGNRMRGVHIALEGSISRQLDYRGKMGHRRAWGNGRVQLLKPIRLTSMMVEATYHPQSFHGLTLQAALGLDFGDMPGAAFGALLTARYVINDIFHKP